MRLPAIFQLRTFLVLAIGLGCGYVSGQNLVLNPGFEDYIGCYQGIIDTNSINPPSCQNWWTATKTVALHRQTCANPGDQWHIPRSGDAFAWCSLLLSQWSSERRTFLQTKLATTLEPGCTYEIKFYVSPYGLIRPYTVHSDLIFVNNMGAYLSKERIGAIGSFQDLVQSKPQVIHKPYIRDTSRYTEISGRMVANGDEQYLTIGVFTPEELTLCQSADGSATSNSVCLFSFRIDDVSVEKVPANPTYSDLLPEDTALSFGGSVKLITGIPNTTWSTGAVSSEITVTKPGKYWYSIEEPCFTHFDTVEVLSDDLVLHIPNAFTPNNDGLNDQLEFWIYGVKNFRACVYDRWGQFPTRRNSVNFVS